MIQQKPEVDRFKEEMRESLRQETLHSRAITFAKHDNVYTCGDNDELVYFIESGQIKLLMLSPEGLENACWPSMRPEIFSASCAFPGWARVWKLQRQWKKRL